GTGLLPGASGPDPGRFRRAAGGARGRRPGAAPGARRPRTDADCWHAGGMATEGRDVRFVIGHDHPALPGHFPGRPVVPGVALLQVKFLQPLLPGEEARVELEPVAASPGARWRFRVLRGDALLASGDVAEATS